MQWFKYLFKPLTYEQQKRIAQSGTKKQRLELAKSKKTNKEILFYLAENDSDSMVRQSVARNALTPLQANSIIASDSNQDVRLALSGRLLKLLPELSIDKQSQLYAFTVQALGTLALDEVLKIRKSLAVTLKDMACAPPSLAAQLARDIEREVSEPILRFCVALEDSAMIDILKTHPAPWAAEAVAQRSSISSKLAKAIIGTNNNKAGKFLISNKGANINEDVLHEIIMRAKEFPEWHKPLITNHKLPEKMVRQLARYTDARLRKLLQEKAGFDLGESELVTEATRRRIQLEDEIQNRSRQDLVKYIKQLTDDRKLNEQIMGDHLALRDFDFVFAALCYILGTTKPKLEKAFRIKKPETICAICWKAGFSMRFAFCVQKEMAGIAHTELLAPRNGTDYPLKEKDMLWQLEFLDI